MVRCHFAVPGTYRAGGEATFEANAKVVLSQAGIGLQPGLQMRFPTFTVSGTLHLRYNFAELRKVGEPLPAFQPIVAYLEGLGTINGRENVKINYQAISLVQPSHKRDKFTFSSDWFH